MTSVSNLNSLLYLDLMFDDGDDMVSDENERQPADSIFTLHGAPIPIHLHRSLSSGGSRAIARKIEVFRLLSICGL